MKESEEQHGFLLGNLRAYKISHRPAVCGLWSKPVFNLTVPSAAKSLCERAVSISPLIWHHSVPFSFKEQIEQSNCQSPPHGLLVPLVYVVLKEKTN